MRFELWAGKLLGEAPGRHVADCMNVLLCLQLSCFLVAVLLFFVLFFLKQGTFDFSVKLLTHLWEL